MYAQKEAVWGGAPPTGTISLEEHRVGGTEIRRLKTDSQLTALCSLFCSLTCKDFGFGTLIALRSALSHIPSGDDPHMPPKF